MFEEDEVETIAVDAIAIDEADGVETIAVETNAINEGDKDPYSRENRFRGWRSEAFRKDASFKNVDSTVLRRLYNLVVAGAFAEGYMIGYINGYDKAKLQMTAPVGLEPPSPLSDEEMEAIHTVLKVKCSGSVVLHRMDGRKVYAGWMSPGEIVTDTVILRDY